MAPIALSVFSKSSPEGRSVSQDASCRPAAESLSMPRARRLEDQISLTVRHATLGPRHLQERHEVQQHHGLRRVAEGLKIPQDLLVGHARVFGHEAAGCFLPASLPQLLNELLLLPVEVLILLRSSAIPEQFFVGHCGISFPERWSSLPRQVRSGTHGRTGEMAWGNNT